MPMYPDGKEDSVNYEVKDIASSGDISLLMLNGAILRIDGQLWINGQLYNPVIQGVVSDGDKGDISVTAGAWVIDAATVGNPKLANIAGNRFKGRVGGASGAPQDLTAAQARTVLASDAGSGTDWLRSDGTWATIAPPVAANGLPVGGATGFILAKNSVADFDTTWVTPPTGGGGAGGTLTDGDKGDITVSNAGATWVIDPLAVTAGKIAGGTVTNAKLATVATQTIKGRVSAGTAVPEDLTPAQARTVICSDSGGGTVNYLRADGTFNAPAGGGGGSSADLITFAGSTNLSATNVEAAIDELDTEKQPLSAALTDLNAKYVPPTTTVQASLKLSEGTNNGANAITLTTVNASLTADYTVSLPSASGTVCLITANQALTQKTIALGSNTVSGTIAEFNTACTDYNFVTSVNGADGNVVVDGSEILVATGPLVGSTIDSALTFLNNAKLNSWRVIENKGVTATTAILTDADSARYLRFTGVGTPTYTIPPNSSVPFTLGAQIEGVGVSASMTIIPGAGVTINKARTFNTMGAMSGWTIIKVGPDEWDLHGDFI